MALLRSLIVWTLLLISSVLSQSEAGHFPEVDHQAYRILGHPEPDSGRDDSGAGRSVTYWPHQQYLSSMRVNESTRHQNSVASGRRNHIDDQQQQTSTKRSSSHYNSNNNSNNNNHINNNSSNNNSDVHCILSPANLQQICSATLGWSSRMRLPNILGHRSHEELSNELTSMNSILNAVSVIDCKAIEQFKLLLCATLSPICIDVVVPPCKHLCLRAKSSCRPALQLHGLDWPKSLDCRQFPSAPEVCISRQPVFSHQHVSLSDNTSTAIAVVPANNDVGHAIGSSLDTQLDRLDRPDDQQLVGKMQASVNTTAISSGSSSTKRRRKDKKDRRVKAKATTTTTTTTTTTMAPSPSEPIDTKTQPSLSTTNGSNDNVVAPDNSNNNSSSIMNTTGVSNGDTVSRTDTDRATSTTTSSGSLKNSPFEQSSSPSTLANSIAEPSTTTTTPLPTSSQTTQTISSTESSPTSQVNSQTSAPSQASNVSPTPLTQDLTQYLCSNLPDWLIKTKLTDNQLMSATKKRKLRIRSYRQIFGHSLSSNRSNAARGSPFGQLAAAATTTTTGVGGKATTSSGLIVNLSYSTKFIYPLGADLYTQLMSDSAQSQSSSAPIVDSSLSQSSSSSSVPSAEALIKSSSKTYLIFGVNSLATATADSSSANIKKIATFVVLWPGAKFNKGLDSQASSDIVKTYRDFKTRGASTCHLSATASPLTNDFVSNNYSK